VLYFPCPRTKLRNGDKRLDPMSKRERELENARSVLLKKMQESQGHQSLSDIRQELRAIDAEMEHLKKIGPRGSPFGSPF
jgi:hypothetical protein